MMQPTPPTREAVKIIADVLASRLSLQPGHIMLTNQKWLIPEDPGLYVAISYVSGKIIGNNSWPVATDAGMTEMQTLNMLYDIQIDLMSYDDSARVLKELAYMALMSVTSEQFQEQNSVQIARNPLPFQDVSMLEESGRLNRYTTTIRMQQMITNAVTGVPYFDDFEDAVPPEVTAQE